MTISHVASSGLSAGSTTSGGSFTLPTGATTNDLLIAWLGSKPYNCLVASGTLLTNYTLQGFSDSGTTANGVGVGSTNAMARTRTHSGTESAPTATMATAPSPVMKAMSAYRKTVAGAWGIQASTGSDVTATGTALSFSSGNMDLAPGDVILILVVAPDDTAVPVSPTLTATGITFSARTQRLTTKNTATGNDGAMYVNEYTVTSGSSSTVAMTYSDTLANSGESEAAAIFIRLREPASTPVNDYWGVAA